jgi:pyridoxamine 5'-phosphate oxidase
MHSNSATRDDPMEVLGRWLERAQQDGVPAPGAMTLATATDDGRPSARIVTLKQLDGDALVFATGLWTRKAEEARANPRVAAVFYWPSLGRQARVEGRAEAAGRQLAEKLFAQRPREHQLQAHVSRQGEEIESLEELRARLKELEAELAGAPVPCPEDWGAVRVIADRVELWEEAADRLHTRQLFERAGDAWRRSLLAP